MAILPPEQWAAWLGAPEEQQPIAPLPVGSLKVTQVR
jgi:hypothetical protein